MSRFIKCIILLTIVTGACCTILKENGYVPFKYLILLEFPNDVATSRTFKGAVKMYLEPTKENSQGNAKELQIHCGNNLNISTISLNGNNIDLSDTNYDKDTEILHIPLNILMNNMDIILECEFSAAIINKNTGVYIDKDTDSGIIIASNFYPTYARNAFPCVDVPGIKANFNLKITTSNLNTAISNQPGDLEIFNETFNSWQFKLTPPMTTSSLAFVIGKLKSVDVLGTRALPMKIWTSNTLLDLTQFSASISYKIIQSLSNALNVDQNENISFDKLGIEHMDQVILRGTQNSQTHYGLVTYGDNKLLWRINESTIKSKQDIACNIAHAFAHLWFGNVVTFKWFNSTWINEGFATYLAYHSLDGIAELTDYELQHQFLLEHVQLSLENDGLLKPLNKENMNNKLSWSKAAAIVHMLKNLAGDKFMKSVHKYIYKHKEESTVPDDLFNEFNDRFENVLIKDIISGWCDKENYPVVHIFIDKDNNLYANQTPFRITENTKISLDTRWYIPIWFEIKNQTNTTVKQALLHPNNKKISLGVMGNQDFIIANKGNSAYFRVNYDEILWQRISTALQDNINVIDPLTRAQLVDDLFNLARGGFITYHRCFAMLEYLNNEVNYYPWRSAIQGLSYLRKRLMNNPSQQKIMIKFTQRMHKFLNDQMNFDIPSSIKPLEMYKKLLAIEWACGNGNSACIENSINLFSLIEANPNIIDPNLEKVVFCTALREIKKDGEKNWRMVWNKYLNAVGSDRKLRILEALACTSNITLLETYLKMSIDSSAIPVEYASKVFSAVLQGNSQALEIALNFLIESYDKIKLIYDQLPVLMTEVADRLITDKQVQRFETFIMSNEDDFKDIISSTLNLARTNMKWLAKNGNEINAYFNNAVNLKFFNLLLLPILGFVLLQY